MKNNDLFFDLNEEEVKQVQEKYALFEPLLDDCISPAQKRVYRRLACERHVGIVLVPDGEVAVGAYAVVCEVVYLERKLSP